MDGSTVRAWRPDVAGVAEVLHARFVEHAYPMHTHDTWTVLIVDDGAVRYDLERREHGALRAGVTLLPPHVPHDGRAASSGGFRKRVLYLTDPFGTDLVGHAVDRPTVSDAPLRRQVARLHAALCAPGEEPEARERLALVVARLGAHLTRAGPDIATPPRDRGLAGRLRELIDAHAPHDVGLDAAAATLHAHPTHLVRAFGREFGMPPHRYLVGRRIDLARRLLLDGVAPATAAGAAGFHDQAHLTRHFRRVVGSTPGRFAGTTTGVQ